MYALRERFEDLLLKLRAKSSLHQIRKGNRSVSEYALEFRRLASKLSNCPESLKIEHFKAGLKPKILEWSLARGRPQML